MIGTGVNSSAFPYSYIVSNGYLHTNLPSGELTISYSKVRVDKEGYPMIPNRTEYLQALTAYVQMMLDRIEWRSQRAPEQFYRDSESQWEQFSRRARGMAQMPSYDKMESIKRMWVRLRPNPNAHNSAFESFITPNARNSS
jgi:hypothetical protein